MLEVHRKTLPNLLFPLGWKKVVDKDNTTTYRALYFKIIEKLRNEDDTSHKQRVGKIREEIYDKVEILKKQRGVNFKVNCLLSNTFLYDKASLREWSIREEPTNRKRQTQSDEHINKKQRLT